MGAIDLRDGEARSPSDDHQCRHAGTGQNSGHIVDTCSGRPGRIRREVPRLHLNYALLFTLEDEVLLPHPSRSSAPVRQHRRQLP